MSKFKLSAKDKAVIEDLYVEFVSEHTDMSLFYSSEIGNDILTELLLERGYSATDVDEEGHDSLWRAVEYMVFEDLVFNENFINVFTMLVEHGSNVEALKSLYDKELDAVQAKKLDKVVEFVSSIKLAESEKSEETAEASEEEADAEEEVDQHDDAEMSDSEENTDDSEQNIDKQNYSAQTANDALSFINKEPTILNLTLGLITDDEDAVPSTPERKAYEKSMAEIQAQLENQTARAADLLEEHNEDSEFFSNNLYPKIPEHLQEKITPPFHILIDPVFIIDCPSLLVMSLTLLSGIIGNQYHNNEVIDLTIG